MPLKYQPKEGSVLICNFEGFVEPEMIKARPVVVLRRHRHNTKLVTVVPLSTTAPEILTDHHVELPCYMPGPSAICWAKCDMVYTVSLARLDQCRTRDRHGGRSYQTYKMLPEHFSAVRAAVLAGLGLREM
ncbi:type II toxin-antitoxin system PemK/MazF family toxin [Stutzerimonas nitrititolerans]|uniref:type II toxin-antitoxin system PemK/MazF family toxin n=1 Tax=Stutzerimonas nitrititolerans TaxID=2482751 RepID=UPI00289A812D|nr:type II toxin-antitoxin system PemK/MazF family toxin [Stutzerimonas nitrititolerans]